jgi:NTP pyrophosphatase (non-canonical NTP hydrolase)
MNINDYQDQAVKTAIYKHEVIYPALGLANEAGEVLGKIKKVLRDNDGDFTPEKRQEIGAEMGDVLWYIAALSRDLDLSMSDIAQWNLNKLNSRMVRGVLGGSGDNR